MDLIDKILKYGFGPELLCFGYGRQDVRGRKARSMSLWQERVPRQAHVTVQAKCCPGKIFCYCFT